MDNYITIIFTISGNKYSYKTYPVTKDLFERRIQNSPLNPGYFEFKDYKTDKDIYINLANVEQVTFLTQEETDLKQQEEDERRKVLYNHAMNGFKFFS